MNLTGIHEDVGLIPDLTQGVKGSDIAVSCGEGRRHGLDLVLLWLWPRLAAVAPIQPLDWELPCALDAALEETRNYPTKKYPAQMVLYQNLTFKD